MWLTIEIPSQEPLVVEVDDEKSSETVKFNVLEPGGPRLIELEL